MAWHLPVGDLFLALACRRLACWRLARWRLARRGLGCCRRLAGGALGSGCGGGFRRCSGLALGFLLFLGLLDLLHDDAHNADLRQAEGAAAVLPALFVLQDLDPLPARQNIAGSFQAVFAAETLID